MTPLIRHPSRSTRMLTAYESKADMGAGAAAGAAYGALLWALVLVAYLVF